MICNLWNLVNIWLLQSQSPKPRKTLIFPALPPPQFVLHLTNWPRYLTISPCIYSGSTSPYFLTTTLKKDAPSKYSSRSRHSRYENIRDKMSHFREKNFNLPCQGGLAALFQGQSETARKLCRKEILVYSKLFVDMKNFLDHPLKVKGLFISRY